jgi:pyrroloquinoline quinone (PQQ) biosynthesis protein C
LSASFLASLTGAARSVDMESTPFVSAVRAGTCDRDAIRRYAIEVAVLSIAFPRTLSAILAVCDDRAARKLLIGNLLEEEGLVSFEHGNPTFDDAKWHGGIGRRFARAAGATDHDVDTSRQRARWFDKALAAGDWVGPLAYVGVGVETNIAVAFPLLVEPLRRHYGFGDDDLTFLTEHIEADERHGAGSAEVLAARATTPDVQGRALRGARLGAQSIFLLHHAVMRAH